MKSKFSVMMIITTLFLLPAIASANEYSDTIALFKNAGESAGFFDNSYAYLVLPNVGKGGLVSEHVGPLAEAGAHPLQALMSLHVIFSTTHKRGIAAASAAKPSTTLVSRDRIWRRR